MTKFSHLHLVADLVRAYVWSEHQIFVQHTPGCTKLQNMIGEDHCCCGATNTNELWNDLVLTSHGHKVIVL